MPVQKVEISMTTTSEVRKWNTGPPIAPPKITLNGVPVPSPTSPAYTAAGWQIVVMDAHKDWTKPDSILVNKYLLLTADGHDWHVKYPHMYTEMLRYILTAGDVNSQLVLLVSYGLDANMSPPNDALAVLLELGAGAKLQSWVAHSVPGHQSPEPDSYVDDPANFALIGYSSWRYGQGHEAFDHPGGGGAAATTLTATLSNIVVGDATD